MNEVILQMKSMDEVFHHSTKTALFYTRFSLFLSAIVVFSSLFLVLCILFWIEFERIFR